MKTVTYERLREVLSYDSETGYFRWLKSPVYFISVGQVAGTNTRRYRQIGVDGRRYGAHRLAFLFMTGEMPVLDVDHADGNGFNNKWDNLRICTVSQNLANTGRHADNSSGFKGVTWDRPRGKWQARIQVRKQKIHLGRFNSAEEAHAAYVAAAFEHFGEFHRAA